MQKKNQTSSSPDSKNVEIRNYPSSLIYDHTSADGSTFRTLSFRFKDRWASLILPEGAVSPSTTRNGRSIEGRQTITLGDPEHVQNVSIQQEDNTYQRTPMFNRTILSAITESRQEYLRSIAV